MVLIGTYYRYLAIKDLIKVDVPDDWKEFRDAQIAEVTATAVSSAIIAQVALTALTFEKTPQSARALYVLSLVLGLISVVTACVNQAIIGSFCQQASRNKDIQRWLTTNQGKKPSWCAAIRLGIPGDLLTCTAVLLVVGLGIYVRHVWEHGTLAALIGGLAGAGGLYLVVALLPGLHLVVALIRRLGKSDPEKGLAKSDPENKASDVTPSDSLIEAFRQAAAAHRDAAEKFNSVVEAMTVRNRPSGSSG